MSFFTSLAQLSVKVRAHGASMNNEITKLNTKLEVMHH